MNRKVYQNCRVEITTSDNGTCDVSRDACHNCMYLRRKLSEKDEAIAGLVYELRELSYLEGLSLKEGKWKTRAFLLGLVALSTTIAYLMDIPL